MTYHIKHKKFSLFINHLEQLPHVHKRLILDYPELRSLEPKIRGKLITFAPSVSEPSTMQVNGLDFPDLPHKNSELRRKLLKMGLAQGSFKDSLIPEEEIARILELPNFMTVLERRAKEVLEGVTYPTMPTDQIKAGTITTEGISFVNLEEPKAAFPPALSFPIIVQGEKAEEGGYQELVGKTVESYRKYPDLECRLVKFEERLYVIRECDAHSPLT